MGNTKIKTVCVQMTGPDGGMDLLGGSYYDFANPLPCKCPHCTFPDLEFVAKPYLLTKGVSSPAETAPAVLGNFLVRERVKRILELAVPGECTFHATAERKSKKSAPWWLVVPKQLLETPGTKASHPRCSKCGEPKSGYDYANNVWDQMKRFDAGGVNIFKTLAWSGATAEDDFADVNQFRKKEGDLPLPWSHWGIEAPAHAERWTRTMLTRDLYFSVRLEQLFKRAKVKGQLVRLLNFKDAKTSPEDELWIEEKLKLLAEHDLVDVPEEERREEEADGRLCHRGKEAQADTATGLQGFHFHCWRKELRGRRGDGRFDHNGFATKEVGFQKLSARKSAGLGR
jgi:hypothetical protein